MFTLKSSKLLNFAYAILRVSQMKKYDKDMKKFNFQLDQDIKKLAIDMESHLSELVLNDLAFLIKKYHICEMIIALGLERPEMTPDEFISYINGLSIEAFRDFYRKYTFNLKSNNDIEEIKEKIQQSEGNNANSVVPTFKDFLVFEREIHLLLPRIIQCLDAFNRVYSKYYHDAMKLQLQQEAVYREYLEDQERFAKDLFLIDKDIYDYRTMAVHVYVILFQEGDLAFRRDMENKKLDMLVGCCLQKAYKNNSDGQLELFKCLADPTKQSIIAMIAHERVCAKDIAQKLKLTKATISYHIARLIMVGIIKIKMQEGKRAYYQVQEDAIKEAFDGYMEGLKDK